MITFQITMDAADPDGLARFWAEMLGYELQPPPPGFATWQDWARAESIPEEKWNDFSALVDPEGKRARFFFQRVPEPKTAKNRMHFDLRAPGAVAGEVARLERLGATLVEWRGHFAVMADPEGNVFCVEPGPA